MKQPENGFLIQIRRETEKSVKNECAQLERKRRGGNENETANGREHLALQRSTEWTYDANEH